MYSQSTSEKGTIGLARDVVLSIIKIQAVAGVYTAHTTSAGLIGKPD